MKWQVPKMYALYSKTGVDELKGKTNKKAHKTICIFMLLYVV